MRISYFIILSLIFELLSFTSIAQVTFQKYYGGNGTSTWASVHHQTTDGGYILAGETNSFGNGSNDAWIVKLLPDGNIEWTKTLGGTGWDGALHIEQTDDDGYIILGYSDSYGPSRTFLAKTNSLGNVEWSRTYQGGPNDNPRMVKQTFDGGYIIGGNTTAFGTTNHDLYLIKTDSAGAIVWQNKYGQNNLDHLYSLEQTPDGGYVMGGSIGFSASGSMDYFLGKTNSTGTLLWSKTYGTTETEYCPSMKLLSDQGFVMCGTIDIAVGNQDILIIKTDSSGDTLWTKTYTSAGNAYSIFETSDKGFIIAGNVSVPAPIYTGHVMLMKIDSSGTIEWVKSYGSNLSNGAESVIQTSDGGYSLFGITSVNGINNKLYMIKTDSTGSSGCFENPAPITIIPTPITVASAPIQTYSPVFQSSNFTIDTLSGGIIFPLCTSLGIDDTFEEENITIFPNPTSDFINIEFKNSNLTGAIKMYDFTGANILNETAGNSSSQRLDISGLPAGLYLVEIIDGKKVYYKKIVISN